LNPKQIDFTPEIYYETLGREYVVEAVTHFCNDDANYHKINDFDDICDWVNWFDGENYRFYVDKKDSTTIEPEELLMLRYKVEKRINNKLIRPFFRMIVTFDGLAPEIGILNINDLGGRIEFIIFIANCADKRDLLNQYRLQGKRNNNIKIDKSDVGLYDVDLNCKDVILKVGLNAELYKLGKREFTEINLTKSPHLGVVANTGGGKSYALRQILCQVGMMQGSKILLADYKNGGDYGDFNSELHRYYTRGNYTQAITDFEKVVADRIEKRDMCRDVRILVLEEYGAYLNSLDKKEADNIKKIVASILYTSRFINCYIFICSQRIFAEQMIYGSRDMLTNVILLADPSSESLQAFCSSDEIKMMKPHQQGEGYLIREGKKPMEIIICKIDNPDIVNEAILRIVTRDV
jgi:hypothetical protein